MQGKEKINPMNFLKSGRAYFGLLSLLRSCYPTWSEVIQNIENPDIFTASMGSAARVDVGNWITSIKNVRMEPDPKTFG